MSFQNDDEFEVIDSNNLRSVEEAENKKKMSSEIAMSSSSSSDFENVDLDLEKNVEVKKGGFDNPALQLDDEELKTTSQTQKRYGQSWKTQYKK